MKKLFLLALMIMTFAISSNAQWKGSHAIDVYTEQEVPQITYKFDYPVMGIVKYINNQFQIYVIHDWSENCDLYTKMNGWLSYDGDVSFNFIGRNSQVLKESTPIQNFEKNTFYFVFGVTDKDGSFLKLMKSNSRLSIRYYDCVTERYEFINFPLKRFVSECLKVGIK